MNLIPSTTEILGTVVVIALLGGAVFATRQIRQARQLAATPVLRPRRREDARTWQDHFAEHPVCSHNFHRPTQNEILETLHALDHLTPGWDVSAPDVVEQRFLNELAQGCPSLCKAGCQFPTAIPVDLPVSLRDTDLSGAEVTAFLKDRRNKAAVARDRFRCVRAHANALEQFAVGADLPDESSPDASPVQADERGWLKRNRWAATGLVLISLAVVGIVLFSAWTGGQKTSTTNQRDANLVPETVHSAAVASTPSTETSRLIVDADSKPQEPTSLENPEKSVSERNVTAQIAPMSPPAPVVAPESTLASTTNQNTAVSTPANLADQIAASKMRAVTKYPDLTVANSEINLRFVYRYKRLVEDSSPRLRDPLWPEQLAAECAAATKPKVLPTVRTRH